MSSYVITMCVLSTSQIRLGTIWRLLGTIDHTRTRHCRAARAAKKRTSNPPDNGESATKNLHSVGSVQPYNCSGGHVSSEQGVPAILASLQSRRRLSGEVAAFLRAAQLADSGQVLPVRGVRGGGWGSRRRCYAGSEVRPGQPGHHRTE